MASPGQLRHSLAPQEWLLLPPEPLFPSEKAH